MVRKNNKNRKHGGKLRSEGGLNWKEDKKNATSGGQRQLGSGPQRQHPVEAAPHGGGVHPSAKGAPAPSAPCGRDKVPSRQSSETKENLSDCKIPDLLAVFLAALLL